MLLYCCLKTYDLENNYFGRSLHRVIIMICYILFVCMKSFEPNYFHAIIRVKYVAIIFFRLFTHYMVVRTWEDFWNRTGIQFLYITINIQEHGHVINHFSDSTFLTNTHQNVSHTRYWSRLTVHKATYSEVLWSSLSTKTVYDNWLKRTIFVVLTLMDSKCCRKLLQVQLELRDKIRVWWEVDFRIF